MVCFDPMPAERKPINQIKHISPIPHPSPCLEGPAGRLFFSRVEGPWGRALGKKMALMIRLPRKKWLGNSRKQWVANI